MNKNYESQNTKNYSESSWMYADSRISLAGSRFIDRLPNFSIKRK